MTAVHSSFGVHSSMSFSPSEADIVNAPYISTVTNVVSSKSANRMTLSGPLPLPSFVFPAKASSNTTSDSPQEVRNTSRRPRSLIAYGTNFQSRSPDSMFRDSATFPNEKPACTSRSSLQPLKSQKSAHMRSDSEFKGGINQNLMSTSLLAPPFNFDGGQPVCSLSKRRGHAHRRSAAISTGDLSIILKPNSNRTIGGSLPTSPSPEVRLSPTSHASVAGNSIENTARLEPKNQLLKQIKGTRVEFSQDIKIIPPPISVALTESLIRETTIRATSQVSMLPSFDSKSNGHNEIEVQETSNGARNKPKISTIETQHRSDATTCSLRTLSFKPLEEVSNGTLSEPTTPRSAKRWTFFNHEATPAEPSPRLDPTPTNFLMQDGVANEIELSPKSSAPLQTDIIQKKPNSVRRSSGCGKQVKKPKKVSTWAGSILSRRSRKMSQKHKLNRRSLTPPRRINRSIDAGLLTQGPMQKESSRLNLNLETDFTNWKPKVTFQEIDPISPIIDLDAALRPFNTPIYNLNDYHGYTERNRMKKKTMHSAAGLGCFTGPGMHYHRRSESAPEFDNLRFGPNRLGTTSKMSMEDVFEEDEDEEWEDTRTYEKDSIVSLQESGDINNQDLNVEMKLNAHEAVNLDKNSKLECEAYSDDPHSIQSMNLQTSKPVTLNKSIRQCLKKFPLITAEEFKENVGSLETTISTPKQPQNSTSKFVSTESNPNPLQPRFTTTPNLTNQLQPHTTPMKIGYDCISISATSKATPAEEHVYESLLLGEPGPELRMSVDDVPSLISCDSTSSDFLARENDPTKSRLRDGKRSASFSATIANRKRSSIASLSRLISSSHGERGKIGNGSRSASYSEEERSQDTRTKGRRISRLKKFWKKIDGSS